METLLFILGAGVIGFVIWAIYRRAKRGPITRSDHICRVFKLNPKKHRLIGSDIGGGGDKVWLEEHSLVGIPDAVFEHIPSGHILIGEAKSRHHRGHVTDYERFQLTSYLGMAKQHYGAPVAGVLRYGCGKAIRCNYDPKIYQTLRRAIPDCQAALLERGRFG